MVEDKTYENEVDKSENHGGKRPQGQTPMPNARMAAQQGLLR